MLTGSLDMISFLKDFKDSTRRLAELIDTFIKVVRCTVNLLKSVAFIYTNNKHAEKEIIWASPLILSSNKIKYPGKIRAKDGELKFTIKT